MHRSLCGLHLLKKDRGAEKVLYGTGESSGTTFATLRRLRGDAERVNIRRRKRVARGVVDGIHYEQLKQKKQKGRRGGKTIKRSCCNFPFL